jgi:AmmeMemoRadiSam system protein A/AmmeMemoRadiSam system protein B
MGEVRGEEVRGIFYDGDETRVQKTLAELGGGHRPYLPDVVALLVPHAGYAYAAPMEVAAHGQLDQRRFRRIFILADNHQRSWFGRGLAVPDFSAFRIFNHLLPIDESFIAVLGAQFPTLPSRDAFGGHVIEVQLPLLLHFADLEGARLVPLIFQGSTGEEREALAHYLNGIFGEKDLILLSSDLSHYLSAENAEARDRRTLEQILSGTFPDGPNALCGPESLDCFQTIARLRGWDTHFLGYGHSGLVAGDVGRVVGYGALAWTAGPLVLPVAALDALGNLALDCVDRAFSGQPMPPTAPFLREYPCLGARRSVFVTLTRKDALRGCIGSLGDFSQTIADGVCRRAIDAAFHDPRFPPLAADERDSLGIHVSILSFPRPLHLPSEEWISHLSHRHPSPGVILEIAGHRSTFLPSVWEQIPTAEAFLAALCQKQGMPSTAWHCPKARLFTYDAQST